MAPRLLQRAGELAGVLVLARGPLAHPRPRCGDRLRAAFLSFSEQEVYLGVFLHGALLALRTPCWGHDRQVRPS